MRNKKRHSIEMEDGGCHCGKPPIGNPLCLEYKFFGVVSLEMRRGLLSMRVLRLRPTWARAGVWGRNGGGFKVFVGVHWAGGWGWGGVGGRGGGLSFGFGKSNATH